MLEVFKAAMPDRKGVFEILDLARECFESEDVRGEFVEWMEEELPFENLHTIRKELIDMDARSLVTFVSKGTVRSEEHTSELQSRGQLVCRLLLEKKKQ